MDEFKLVSDYKPEGDQPKAIEQLTEGILKGYQRQVLLGVTGSGKTFTIANVIAQARKPTLVISHNKTLAAQLYSELSYFFPENAVEYFISYYDYYQPEAYIPQTDTYIEKDASINEEIDRLRLSTTTSLLTRDDVIVVASVSCIYGLGSPQDFQASLVILEQGNEITREEILRQLVRIYYERNDLDFTRGKFRVRGDIIDIFPADSEIAVRVELFDEKIGKISEINPLKGLVIREKEKVVIYPAKHFITTSSKLEVAIKFIEIELEERLAELRTQNKLLEAQRLEQRTRYDLEMLREIGYCTGVENYSRHLSGRKPGERPSCLIDYFPLDFLMIIDESHVTIPQLNGMYNGDRSRKETLVGYGFRLPSALDNRPLKFAEFEQLSPQTIYVSATPGSYERRKSRKIVEQIIRPTGLVDPEIIVRPTKGQIDDLLTRIKEKVEKKERILVTTLTKRMAEDLCDYLNEMGASVRYLHSEIGAIERVEILRDLRLGKFDVLIGINLLREGLDLPEVALVAVLDADKEGFLRSETSLIQVSGRTARNIDGQVVMYADELTSSMKGAIKETNRRRFRQMEYNHKHHITPQSIKKSIREIKEATSVADRYTVKEDRLDYLAYEGMSIGISALIIDLERQMAKAAQDLEFEKAAMIRDKIAELRKEIN